MYNHGQTMLPLYNSEEVLFRLNRVKGHVNNLHRTSELQFNWTDLFSGVRDRFSGPWGHVFGFVLPCLFIFVLICVSVHRSLTSRVPARVSSSQQYTGLLARETSCQVSNKELRGLAPPGGHKDRFKLRTSEQTAAAERGLL